ncbi:endothelin-3b [Denticeps clupeoides]|uniref:Endothelin-3 n=1 Tax=Denticeps clupeoides TaxID=299321 RepID=A0AAY4B8Z8_9TELE|nr:endothelin-3-like [Denticeps clupeoides]
MAGICIHLGILLFICFVSVMGKNPCAADDPPEETRDLQVPSQQPAGSGSESARRSKRCTCYSYKDKECVYYCHLDIIWINTPERTVPYGMSSYRGSQRIRRSSESVVHRAAGEDWNRCVCMDQTDRRCAGFCERSKTAGQRARHSFMNS